MSPVKRIKPLARGRKTEGEIRRPSHPAVAARVEMIELDGGWTPRLDLSERGAEVVVEMEAAGLSSTDIQIVLYPNRLTIKGTKGEDVPQGRYKYLRLEREYGAFRRTLPLPKTVVPDKARAFLENGLLTVRMPVFRSGREKGR